MAQVPSIGAVRIAIFSLQYREAKVEESLDLTLPSGIFIGLHLQHLKMVQLWLLNLFRDLDQERWFGFEEMWVHRGDIMIKVGLPHQ